MGLFNKYLGIVGMAVILYYLFKDAGGTSRILSSLSDFNTKTIVALQGNAR